MPETPSLSFARPSETARKLHLVQSEDLTAFLDGLAAPARRWLQDTGFAASWGELALVPGADGALGEAVLGTGRAEDRRRGRFVLARAAERLPLGDWEIATPLEDDARDEAALAWALADPGYSLKSGRTDKPRAAMVAPEGFDTTRIEAIAAGERLTRRLINTPANLMGPDELEAEARALAETHGAQITVTVGDALLEANFPLIHTVGRASSRAPRLIDVSWGTEGPTLTLVGKGVCFDTGGLNLKPGSSMGLMKKDMGGSATVLGLAHMIMALGLKLQLRVLIPAVENAVAGSAFRPGDILTSRSGQTVEINNTDAEGRLVLADALSLGGEAAPDLMVSMATLTGAARVAVGPDLAPFYSTSASAAAAMALAAEKVRDPVWQMPFHAPYETMIEPSTADLDNAPKGGFAGSITAALFLKRFATGAQDYMHFDIYGWQPTAAPARPQGGVGQGARALLEALPAILGPEGV